MKVFKRSILFLFLLLFLSLLFSLSLIFLAVNYSVFESKVFNNKQEQPQKLSEKTIVYELEGKSYRLLVAETPQEWQRGLMFIKCPCDFDGMLFVFPDKKVRKFWNKNTYLDLEIYWIQDQKIIGKDYLPSISKTKTPITVVSPQNVNAVVEVIKK